MRNLRSGRPVRRAHCLMIGMKTTTTGVLFRNADTEAIAGRMRTYPCRTFMDRFSGSNRPTRCPSASLRRTPSLTKNSSATVMTPLFPNPASTSSGVRMPVHMNSTTTENRTRPGRSRSLLNNPTIRQRPDKTIHISVSLFIFRIFEVNITCLLLFCINRFTQSGKSAPEIGI